MWAALIPIIAQYGLPLAEKLFQKWTSGANPTQADFDELNALASVKAVDVMKAQLAAAGIDLTDPHAVALLALVQPPTSTGTTPPPPPAPAPPQPS